MKKLSISFLGSLEINLDNVPIINFAYDKVWALLVYLIVESHQVHHRESLAALLWPDFPSERARSNLRQTLATLRQMLGDRQSTKPFLSATRQTIQFNADSSNQSDLAQFLAHLETVGWPLADQLSLADIVQLEQALICYKGEFLATTILPVEEPFEEWVMFTRTKLQQQAIDICHSLVIHHEQQQQWNQALQYAHRSLELEPCNELMHQAIMRVSTSCGQRSAAVQQYQTCCQILEKQLAITPDPATTALYEQIQNCGVESNATIPLVQNGLVATPALELDKSIDVLEDLPTAPSAVDSQPVVIADQSLDLTATDAVVSSLNFDVAINQKPIALDSQQYCRNRLKMLEKVQVFWVQGVLENSLHNALMIELGLENRSISIEQPWNLLTPLSDQTSQQFPENTKILDIYDQFNRSLLILGEPGAGKTTLLLDLTRSLLMRATQDFHHPLPVVFNLSSWSQPSCSISSWLIDELQVRYQVPKQLAQQWIQEAKVLPLLDGLDEVVADQREACVQAINQFRSDYWLTDLVVCSRVNDYEALTIKLQLNNAVLVQQLSPLQIDRYLDQLGDRLIIVQKAIHQNQELQELIQTPLMLSILVLVYRDASLTWPLSESLIDWRRNLFTSYIQRMLRHRGATSDYDDRAVDWLIWLATILTQRNQSMFFIEQIQPDLLLSGKQQFLLNALETISIAILVGVLGGMGVGVHHASSIGWADGLLPWLERGLQGIIQGASIGLLTGIGASIIINIVAFAIQRFFSSESSHPEQRWRQIWSAIRFGTAAGFSQGTAVWIFLGADFGVSDSFMVTLAASIAALKFLEPGKIRLFEALGWSWTRAKQGILPGFLLGLLFGAIHYVVYSIEYSVVLAPAVWLIMIMGFGLNNSDFEIRVVPNQGIFNTAKSALRVSLATGILYAVANGVGCGLSVGWPVGIGNGFSAGITLGTCCWLICGGFACIQHLIIRGILYKNGFMPWNYAAFLDYGVEKTFLRRVGGGYVFLHRLLLEYFAELNDSQLGANNHEDFPVEALNKQSTKFD
jgi:DNA-binding SARP family transcriptional activator